MSTHARRATVATLASAIALSAPTIASASPTHTHTTHQTHAHIHGPALGTVQTVDTSSFTILTHKNATITVDVSPTTVFKDKGVASPSIANVSPGETVLAFGQRSADVLSASRVRIAPATLGSWIASQGTIVAHGTVLSTASDSFVIQTKRGRVTTVDVNSSTSYYQPGTQTPTLANVTTASRVAVFGSITGTTATATGVLISPAKTGSAHPHFSRHTHR